MKLQLEKLKKNPESILKLLNSAAFFRTSGIPFAIHCF